MDWQDIAMSALGVVVAGGGAVIKALWAKVERIERSLPDTYVRKDEINPALNRIYDTLDDINKYIRSR